MKKEIGLLVILAVLISSYYFYNKNKTDINWQFFIDKQIGVKSVLNVGKNLTFDNDYIYFGDRIGNIYSISQSNGSINWVNKLDDHTPFEITQDDASIYISSFDSHIYKIDKKNGYIVWSYAIDNQYWPDTEIIFDNNDKYVFFADRGGNLYALNKDSGNEVWKKEFQTIDNAVDFKDGSIHFGFLTQNEDELMADHFPSKTIYTINKDDGSVTEERESLLSINLQKEKELLSFDKYDLKIESNVADQPALNLFDKNENLVWTYQTRGKINSKEVYQDKNRAYFLDINNQILSSIMIDPDPLEEDNIIKTNFIIEESFSSHDPFNISPISHIALNPHIRFEKESSRTEVIKQKIKEVSNYFKYVLDNFKQLFEFSINSKEENGYLEFSILHQDNFYKNKFTEVKINGEFENKLTNEKLKISGFYYDKNIWKVRAKLGQGEWNYQIKAVTPFWGKKFEGIVQVNKSSEARLKIKDNQFVLGENLFLPMGLQDAIIDLSRDGNKLNKMGHAFSNTPPTENYSFLPFKDYLELYKNDASMNIFRYGPDNWAPSIWENLSEPKHFEMDINGNYQGDFIVQEAKERGYKVIMSIFAFYSPHSSQEAFTKKSNRQVLEKYLDYVIARYGTSVDIWELANEAIPSQEWQDFVSDYLKNHDPYQHPITISLEEPELKNSNLLSIHYVAEVPNDNRDFVYKIETFNSKYDENMVKIISEFTFRKANHFSGSADWMRKYSWAFSFQNTGVIFWNTGFGYYENFETQNSNIYLGPEERYYLNNLRDFLPTMSAGSVSDLYYANDGGLAVFNLGDDKFDLFYLLNLNGNNQVLEFEVKTSGVATIINTKTGTILQEFPVGVKKQQLNLPYFDDDLAIKISYD